MLPSDSTQTSTFKPQHSASNFVSHRGVPISTSFYGAFITRFWRHCRSKNFQFQSNGWKIQFVIEQNQFRGEIFRYLYENELEVGLLPTPRDVAHQSKAARPYESFINYARAAPPEMPLRNWYNCGTKHFHPIISIWRK